MPKTDGIDIAHYQWDQGPVDLNAVHAIPAFWFATKATQSTAYVDPTFAKARAAAHAAGFRHIGLYHWLSSTTDPVAQADHFLATIGTLQPGEFVMGDFEEAGIAAAGCLAFNERIESRTQRPVVGYSGLYVSGGTIWKSVPLRTSRYGPRPFIVAAYVTEANLAARMISTGSINYPHDGWQFASGGIMPNGLHLPGIVGRCDMDQIDNVEAFDLASGLTAGPKPVPIPVPTPSEDIVNYYVVTGANARFIGTPAAVQWTGPGDAKVQAAIDTQLAAGNLTLVNLTGGPGAFGATFLTGPLPTGDSYPWSGDEFANAAAIKSRGAGSGVDLSATVAKHESAIVALNDAMGRVGQRQSTAGKAMADAGAALLG